MRTHINTVGELRAFLATLPFELPVRYGAIDQQSLMYFFKARATVTAGPQQMLIFDRRPSPQDHEGTS